MLGRADRTKTYLLQAVFQLFIILLTSFAN